MSSINQSRETEAASTEQSVDTFDDAEITQHVSRVRRVARAGMKVVVWGIIGVGTATGLMVWDNAQQEHEKKSVTQSADESEAEALHRRAMENYGFSSGTVDRDLEDIEICIMLDEAASMGNPEAAFHAALLDEIGFAGAKPSREELIEEYLEAARMGEVRAQWKAGMLLQKEGMHKEAFHWFIRAAQGGFDDAYFHVARYYETGDGGVAIDYDKAHHWYEIASEEDPRALEVLAWMHNKGLGVPKNLDVAKKYLKRAKNLDANMRAGNKDCRKDISSRSLLSLKFTSDQKTPVRLRPLGE